MKFLIGTILLLASCGSDPSQFEKDFGTSKLTFTKCIINNANENILSTVEYVKVINDGRKEYQFIFTFDGVDQQVTLRRLPYSGVYGDLIYFEEGYDIQVIRNETDGNVLFVNNTKCSE